MKKLNLIAAFIAEHGPATTREIADHFGWRLGTASAAASHANSYGLIARSSRRGETPAAVWTARDHA